MMIPVSCTPELKKGICLSNHQRTDANQNPFSSARIFTRSVFFLLATLLISVVGMGQTTRTWIPTNGGSWTTATNWNPAGVPVATDTLVINTTQTATITSVPQITVASLRVSGSCSLETGGNNQALTVSGYLYIAPGVTLAMGTGKMHLTLAAGARGDIQGVFTQSSSGFAKVFTCSGDLTIGPNGYVDGPGDFLLTPTGTLRIGSVNGIVAGAVASGNIRVTGTRTYDPAAAYIYNGTASQVTGDGLPATLTNSLTINNPTTVTLSAARTISTGTLNLVNGTFAANNLLTLGNSTAAANATLNRSGGNMTGNLQGGNWYTVVYLGDSKNSGQEFSGTGFRNLTVNMNSQQSVTLAASRTVPGTLTLTSGVINTGSFAINLTGALSGGNGNSYINGNLQRSIAAGANSYTFPIGTSTAFAPVTLNFGASTVAGSLTGSTTNGDNPFIGLTTINSFRSVNRTWQFAVNSGLTSATYGAVFNWPVSDQDADYNYLSAIVGRFAGFAWTLPTIGAITETSIEATGMSAFGEFQVGQSCQITTINTQPVGGAICPGSSMELSVQASGEGTLTYQWRKDGQDISGATASTLAVTEAGTYSVVVTGECRSAASEDAVVTMNTATSISADPVGGIICPGQQQNLSVSAIGEGALTYQWKKDGEDIPQAVNDSYAATAEGNYSVVVTGVCGTVQSAAAFVKVNKATSVITQPEGGAVCLGQEITLRVNADGEGTLSYQWKKNGEDIFGATSLSYTTSTEGQYTVSVTGECGTVSSSTAEAIINPLTQINSQPQNESITYGSDVSFGLQASGTGELSYMWMVNAGASWAQLSQGGVYGVTSVSQLDITNPAVAYSGYQYKCIVSGACGQVESDPVTLEVKKATLTVNAEDKRKTYGEVNPALTVTISGFARNENISTSGVTGEADIQTVVDAQSDAGTYSIVPSVGTLSAPNYQFTFQNGSIIVDKAVLQVKADDKSKTYGDQNPLLTASYSGFVNGQTLETSGVTGEPSIVTIADKSSVVGQYLITIDAGTLSSSNYAFSFVDGKMDIGKAAITVTADDKTRIYGEENPSLTFTYNGFVNGQTMATSGITGSPVLNTDATPTTAVGEYPISVAKGTLASSNYDFTLANGTLSVTKAVLTVTADDKSKVYGDENPALTASFSGFVNGETSASAGITGTPTLTTSAVKVSGVGAYDIFASKGTLSSGNYSFSFEKGKLNIGKATVTITADDKTRVYGGSNPLFTASFNGFVNGETLATSGISGAPDMSTSANEQSEVGNYDITIGEGTLSSSNYSFTVVGGKLAVTKAVITVTADDRNKIYGQTNPDFTASYNGFVNGESLATSGISGTPSFATDATASSPVGNYLINVSGGTLASANYSFTYASGKLSVGKATVTITADNKSRLYGQSNPSFTASYNGFVNGESLATSGIAGSPSLASLANANSPVGAYDITASEGTLLSSNYSFQFVDGKLSVDKATVTITAENKSRIYGQSNPVFTASYNGFVNSESLATSGISGSPSMTTLADEQSAVGVYDINITTGTLSSSNYSFTVVGGKLSVTKAVITVTADDKSKIYGEANPSFTASYTGFVNGESLANSGLTGTPSFTTDATLSSPVGNYVINVSEGTLSSANYSFSYEVGKLSVGKATVTITAENKSRLYGQSNPTFTAAFNGFVNGESLATSGISGVPSFATSANAASPVGVYDVTVSEGTLVSANYAFAYASGKLSVDKATVKVKAEDKVKVFGDPNPSLTANYIGFVNGETLATSGITGSPVLATSAEIESPVGEYAISVSSGTLASSNYNFTYESGKMSVTRAIITVTAENKVKTYGQPNPELTIAYSGFRQGENLSSSGLTGSPVVTTSATQSSAAGSYTINVAQGTLASSNYEFDFKNGSLTIQKAVLKVTADDKARNYGDANPQWSISYNGFVNGETLATSGITGTPQVTTEANTSSAAGNYAINVSAGTMASSNYSFDWVSGKLTVEKVLVVITADNKTRAYGEENPSFTASYFGFANGETFATSSITGSPEFYTVADATSPVGEYMISLRLGTLASTNYNFTYLDGSLQVTKSTITVAADDKSKVYGEANPAMTVSYNGFKNGETLATSGITGAPSLQTDATVLSGVGNYNINLTAGTLASSNYSFVYVNGKLAVTKAVVTITADDKSKVYGQPNPELTYVYSGFANGEALASSGITGLPVLSTTANMSSGTGVYDIVVDNGTLASSNYSFQLVNGKLSISKAVVTITVDDKSKVYGQVNPVLTASFAGFVNDEVLATSGISGQPTLSTDVTAATGVGVYPISIAQGSLVSSNYSFVLQEGKMAVTKAVITVTADDKSKIYGSANPVFTASYNGFVNGETLTSSGVTGSPSMSTNATIESGVGNYAIIPVPGTLASSNYSFVYVDGKLSIGKALVTITAENKNRAYGEANPVFTASYNGFVNGESLATSGISGTPSLSTSATEGSSVGVYDIVAESGSMAAANYSFNFVNGKLNIGKAVVTVTADDKIKAFGQSNPVLTASYNGFVNGENISTSGISGQPVLATEVTTSTAVGTYPITIQEGTLAASNYTFVLQEGKFKVSKAVITVTAEDKTKVYGSANPILTATYNGFVNGETMATSGMSGTPALNTQATASSGVGAYDITVAQGSLSAPNYDFNYVSGKLSVTKATVRVIAVDTFRLYGAADPIFAARYEGFVNGEVLASSGISGTPSFTTDATIVSPVDVYTLTPAKGTLAASNYQFEYVSGKFNVGKATVTVKANNASRLYGQDNPEFTAAYTGLVNGETVATSGILGQPSLVTTATASSVTGEYDINASVGSLFSHNYTFSYEKGSLTVGKAVIKVKADDKSRSYGISNPELTASYNGFVNGETLASSGITGVPVLNTSATITSEAGVYDITVSQGTLSSSNYSFSFEIGKLSIGRNIITVTADKMTRKYGSSNPVFTASFSGFLNGETLASSGISGTPVFTTIADPTSPVGEYAIVIDKGSLSSGNYEFAFVNGFLNVEKATIKVTPVDANRTYGAANPDFTAIYNGFVNGETLGTSGVSGTPVLTTDAIATSPVGIYAIDATIGSLAASNYDFSFAKGNMEITKAQLTVTADAKTRTYGSANPALTATISGFVNNETLATSGVQGQASLATDANVNSPVGQYTITASLGTLVSNNYSFTYATGKLSVTKASIIVKADDKSRPYGSSNPALTVSYSGFVNGESLGTSGVSGSVAVTTTATELSAAGQYDIVSSTGTLAASNYDFQFEKGTLTVNKVAITVTIDNKNRTYGAANPVFTATYNGFVSGQTLATSGITGSPVLSTSAVANSPVGSYDIIGSAGTLASANYDFNFVKGTLQIGKAGIIVKADDIDKSYGNAVPALTVSYIGLLNGESLATSGITGSPELNTTATAMSPLGTYPISIDLGSLASGNYSFTFQPGILTVGKAVITVMAESKVRTYGENNPQLTFTYSGFVNGETLATSGVTGAPVIYTNANVMTDAGDHDIIVTAGTLASSSYDFKFVKGTLTIRKAMLTVTPEHKSRSYGAPDPAFTVTYSGFVYGELLFTSAITGTPVMTTNATATSPVGSYEIYASLGTLYSPNYDFTFAKGTLTIGKTTLLVKAEDVSRAYGSANPVFEASYTGFVNGETYATSGLAGQPSMTTLANATSEVGAYDIQTGLGTLESANYIFTFAKGTLTVNKAIINVVAENKSRLYFEDDPALTYTFNGFVNGENIATGGITGTPDLSTDVIPYSNAGTYPIFITPGNLTSPKYTFNMVDGTFTIRKRTLTVTPDNKSRLYGQSNPAFTASYAGFVAGENYVSSVKGSPAYTTTASVTSPIGTYDINASMGTLTADNYDFVFSKGTLTIGKAVLTVKADSKNKLYGATNPAMTVTYSGFRNGETLATSDLSGAPAFSTTANLLSPVGDYPITIAQGTLASGNYTFQFVNSTLAVVKATILVNADNKTKIYGTPNPALTYTFTGFVNGETLATSGVAGTPVISTTATASSVAGNYDITTSLGTLTSSNYLFVFIKGTMTVAKATITVTPDNKWRVYGEQNPAFTASYSGFINGESWATSGITGAPALATTATPASGAGSYDITASLGTLAASNYTFEYAKGTLNIGKATVTVTPDNKSRIYGAANPVLTASYTGFVNGESLATSGITGSPVITTAANVSSPVGSYDINTGSGSLSSANYDFIYSKGTMTVGKATVTVTADNKSRVYGAANPVFTASYNGFVNGEGYSNSGITGTPAFTTPAVATSPVGSYDINASVGTLSAANYDFVYVKGALTIGKAVLTVTAESKGRLYAEANPQFTVAYSGFVNGETLASSGVTGTPAITTSATIQSSAGEYAIVPAIGTLAASNYSFAFENGKLWVGKVTLNVIADHKSRPYGSLNPELTITYSGFVSGETLATSGVTGKPTISTTAITSSPMGVYPISVTIGTMSSVNYDFNFVLGNLTVGKATITVTADNKSKTYGAANPTLTYILSGFVNGETLATSGVTGTPAMSTTATVLSSVGTYDITPAIGTLAASKYDFVFVKGSLAVDKALITVTGDNKIRAYGAANPSFTASYNGFMNGETLATSGVTGAPSMATVATVTSGAGNYAINTTAGTLASANYKFSYVNGVLTVAKAVITVTADDKSRIYGAANPTLTATYNGFVNGEAYATSGISGTPTIQTSATPLTAVGAYDITISAGSLLASNYDFRFVNGKLNIGKATIIVTPDNKSRIYGDANPDFTASYRGFVNGEVLSTSGISGSPALTTMATPLSPAGDYFIYAAGGTLASGNYDFTYETGILKIGKAIITVNADNKNRLYGQQNPALTATFTGFKNGEALATSDISGSASLITSAVAGSSVGNYPITAAKGSLTSGNYDFTFVNGVLTIGKATVTITADNKSRIYGAANPAFTATYNGFVNGENLANSGISGVPVISTTATAASSTGTYDISIANGSLSSVNYDFNLVKGTLTIGKATITVTADSKSRIYGAANPDFTASYSGFVNGETLATSGISGTPQLITSATTLSSVGTYDINATDGSLASQNYDFTFVKGTLTIGKAIIMITADDKSRKYGEANPAFTARYSGFVNGETLATSGITGLPALATVATPTSTVGTYEITAATGTLASGNYGFSFTSGLLTIGKSMITVTADNASRIYGSPNPDFTATYTGFVNGETLATSGILGTPSLTTVATTASGVGTYPIVPAIATLFSPNYDFSFVSGVLTINKATLTVTADSKTRGYGEQNPVFTASYSGFVNGQDLASSDVTGSPALTTTASITSSLGTYPISAAKGSLGSGNYDFILVNGTLTIGGPVCNVSGSLVVADNCYGSKISLTYINNSFNGPYTLTINDSVYKDIYSGVPFVTAALAKSVPESIWSTTVIGQDPATPITSAMEVGVKFRPNVDGQITGIRFYKRSGNTGTHVGSLWTVNGELLGRATFTNESATGWQQVNFSTPVTVTPGQTYVASYYAPKGNVAYTPNAFTDNRITNGTGTLTVLKGSEGGNGIYKMGAGFPTAVSADNGNYYVDVVFNNAQSISRFNLTSVISAAGCATLSESIQALDVKMQPLTGVSFVKQDPLCQDGENGSITLNAIGCNTPYSFSIDNGATYSSSSTFMNLKVGTYQVKVKDASNFIKDTTVVLGIETAVWTGDLSTDWHNAANWSTGKVPSSSTHVIIPFTAKECYITAQDVTVASIQVKQGAIFRALDNRKVTIVGTCSVLPSE